jgi:hypothetical protein
MSWPAVNPKLLCSVYLASIPVQISNDFAGDKGTFLLLFLDPDAQSRLVLSITSPHSTTFFLRPKARRHCQRNADVLKSHCGTEERIASDRDTYKIALTANRDDAGKAPCHPCRSQRNWSKDNPDRERRRSIPPAISKAERPRRHAPLPPRRLRV